ncbi:MAG: hypothetical protein K2X49_27850 [Acetobacteraceae bacterium]|nr:hypothetical protein [Acetobacteraceae bacterium]
MFWIFVALLIVLGLPLALLFAGFALAIWITLAVAGLVWALVTFLFGWPVLGIILALALGIGIGRAMARP